MRTALILLFSLQAVASLAQELAKTLLWRIETEDHAPSYLYGTVHSKDERAFQFTDSVLPALRRCELVAGELDLDAQMSGTMDVMNVMLLPNGQRLEDLYRRKEMKVVESALRERLGPLHGMFARVKPLFIMAMLTEGSMNEDRTEMLDDHLLRLARDNGQRVAGIETIEEQLAAMDAIPIKEQARMLLDQIQSDEQADGLDALLEAYVAQDLDAIMAMVEKGWMMEHTLETALLTTRNATMVMRMDSIMRSGTSSFFLIGAAHLPGPTGTIQGLRDMGHVVRPVMATRTAAIKEH